MLITNSDSCEQRRTVGVAVGRIEEVELTVMRPYEGRLDHIALPGLQTH